MSMHLNLHRQIAMFTLLLALPLAAFAVPYAPSAANAADFLPERDYTVLATPLPTSTGNKIEVREFFYYGCSHCFDLEGPIRNWLKRKTADIEFVRTPAILNPAWETLGRAFYVAEELKVLEKIHAALYNAIHLNREKFSDQAAVGKFFVRMGVPQADFDAAWNSFSVNTKVKNAEALARKYMIQGTPTLTVNGRYLVPAAGDRTFAIVEFLADKERARPRK